MLKQGWICGWKDTVEIEREVAAGAVTCPGRQVHGPLAAGDGRRGGRRTYQSAICPLAPLMLSLLLTQDQAAERGGRGLVRAGPG